jgi:predicted nicotinamide N-methyase
VTPRATLSEIDKSEQLESLVADLQRRFRTTITDIPVGDRTYSILRPANADDLIREEDFVKDERLPYWADIWPSSLTLGAKLLETNGDGRNALELGCGVGLCTLAATSAGFAVTATDYYEDALDVTRANVLRNLRTLASTRLVDWRHLPGDLGRYDLVFASDVLYEVEYAELLPGIFARALAPGGFGLVADPGRVAAPLFVEASARAGLEARVIETRPFEAGEIRQRIDIYRITRENQPPS